MSMPNESRKRLPVRPSAENLKKQAKRRAKRDSVQLTDAQHTLAIEYGCRNWAELMQLVEAMNRGAVTDSISLASPLQNPLQAAVRNLDLDAIQQLLTAGQFTRDELECSLFDVVQSGAAIRQWPRIKSILSLLLEAGANPRRSFGDEQITPLHLAARNGPLELVEFLIRHGARDFQPDKRGQTAIDHAREGSAPDSAQIIELLHRPVIRDPHFKQAVAAIHRGDLSELRQLLARFPNLVHDRAVEPDCYPQDYFRDPKLLWFVANNPTVIQTMPANSVELAVAIIDAGADQADLDYTLGLVMTSQSAREQRLQQPLMKVLLSHGAKITEASLFSTLGHRERGAMATLLESGLALTAPIAAGMGLVDDLAKLLPSTDAESLHAALSLAVINQQFEAVRLCLAAGADPNQFLIVHAHSLPMHQAVANNDVPLLKLLIEHGAKLDIRDKLWDGTPLGWAVHTQQAAAETFLRSLIAT
ncbi:MAG: Ankyrin repeat-containing protein [Planctomycetaceae bacterium]|nr:Ankyrin repeat-containing protein [Planctomycetaceae bacterium]